MLYFVVFTRMIEQETTLTIEAESKQQAEKKASAAIEEGTEDWVYRITVEDPSIHSVKEAF